MSLARFAQAGNEKFGHDGGIIDPHVDWLSPGTVWPGVAVGPHRSKTKEVTTMSRTARTSSRRRSSKLRRFEIDLLERRELLAIEPISLANPSYVGPTANDTSGSMPSLSVAPTGDMSRSSATPPT